MIEESRNWDALAQSQEDWDDMREAQIDRDIRLEMSILLPLGEE